MSSDRAVGSRTWGVLGVPSSVAAHWPGIEKAPEALRTAGLFDTLREHGVSVADHGDLPVARWNAHVTPGRPNAWQQVVEVVDTARAAISEVIAAGQAPLVLGGECRPGRRRPARAVVAAPSTPRRTPRCRRAGRSAPPLADIATYGTGMRLDHIAPLLATLIADPRVVGMTVVEANPDHDPDGTSIRQLVAALGRSLAGHVR
jgi:arginase family enzyme